MLQRMQREQNFNVFEFVNAMRDNRTYMVQTLVSTVHACSDLHTCMYVVPFLCITCAIELIACLLQFVRYCISSVA